jgi:hypothetical protein
MQHRHQNVLIIDIDILSTLMTLSLVVISRILIALVEGEQIAAHVIFIKRSILNG